MNWCSAWAVSALYLSASADSMTGRFQPCGIHAVPGSSGERVWKQELKHLLFVWSHEQSQSELWDQHTCISTLGADETAVQKLLLAKIV